MKKFLKKEKLSATSVVEIIAVVFIALVLLSVTISYSKQSSKIILLNRDVIHLSAKLTQAKNLSLALLKEESGISHICAWGLHFPTPPASEYYLFFDKAINCNNSDKKWTNDSETKEVILLDQGIEITSTNFNDILFWPPDPTVYFYPPKVNQGTIIISTGNYQKKIKINKLGQLSFE